MGVAFWQTPMGRRFFEVHVPELILAIKGLTQVIAKLLEKLEAS
jgi:hypothetical protein